MPAALSLIVLPARVNDEPEGEEDGSLLPPLTQKKARLHHSDRFGDNIPLKPKNTLWLGFQNIGGFPSLPSNIKEDYIRTGISNWNFDVMGLVETNTDWRLKTEDTKLWTRTREWFEHLHISYSHNTTFPPSTKNNMEAPSFSPSTTQPIESSIKVMMILT
jgi:hypothetical protein